MKTASWAALGLAALLVAGWALMSMLLGAA